MKLNINIVMAAVGLMLAALAADAAAQQPQSDATPPPEAPQAVDAATEETPSGAPSNASTVIIAVGAPGAPEYAAAFAKQARQWRAAAEQAGATCQVIGLEADETKPDREQLQARITAATHDNPLPLWIVLIGHGTYDGRTARFNLRGPDLTAQHLADWLADAKRPIAVINTSSASAPFLSRLAGPGRVIVTATKSGSQVNATRFGVHIAKAIGDPGADLDQDGQTSLLEAFLVASRAVADSYKAQGLLATEHALLDDNADGLGTRADWFRGVRAIKRPAANAQPDGLRAHQLCLIPSASERAMPPHIRERRDALERAIATLRDRKRTMDEDAYYAELESLAVEIARLYESNGR